MTRVFRKNDVPPRTGLTHAQTWDAEDRGIIQCWENGRELAVASPSVAKRCLEGELPILAWKGGVSRDMKLRKKIGSFKYLAQWQGLRGEDLDIDSTKKHQLVCSLTKVVVTFTSDRLKYLNKAVETDKPGEKIDGRLASGISEQSLF
ncbi:hypothetical protein N027_03415 [Pseudomonas syringae USA007]|uniref:Uncharacterized protein n=1 Tax=Pseudomonas syringae USA007 TaxID=1357288 RepID=A0AAU8M9V2_PSESX|nr:hypothetical protein [Pseudomonas syringae]